MDADVKVSVFDFDRSGRSGYSVRNRLAVAALAGIEPAGASQDDGECKMFEARFRVDAMALGLLEVICNLPPAAMPVAAAHLFSQ